MYAILVHWGMPYIVSCFTLYVIMHQSCAVIMSTRDMVKFFIIVNTNNLTITICNKAALRPPKRTETSIKNISTKLKNEVGMAVQEAMYKPTATCTPTSGPRFFQEPCKHTTSPS